MVFVPRAALASLLVLIFCLLATHAQETPSADESVGQATEEPQVVADKTESRVDEPDSSDFEEVTDSKEESISDEEASNSDDESGPALKPRLQIRLKSLSAFTTAIDQSSFAPLTHHFAGVISEANSRSSEGIEHDQLAAMLEIVCSWPEMLTEVAVFAPDREGLPRWSVRVGSPVEKAHDLVRDMLEDERLVDFFEGADIVSGDGRFTVVFGDQVLLYLQAEGTGHTTLASHVDLPMPDEFFAGAKGEQPPLLAAQLSFQDTEKDSGGTFFSKLNLIKSVDYTLRSREDGNWQGEFRVNWPPILGMAAKPFVGRTKQTFFVPDEAFVAGVAKIIATGDALDKIVGFEENQGILSGRVSDDLCVAVLPGTGFLPVPDVVLQCRLSDSDELFESATKAIAKVNKKSKNRDDVSPWHEGEVHGHKVVWNNNPIESQAFVPFTLRPIFFVQKENDGKGREREFLVIGFTSTDPEKFVERWLDLDRDDESRFLPSERGFNAEAWVHWKQLLDWIVPYVNMGLNGTSTDFVIQDSVAEQIEDARITVKLKYEGLRVVQDGPIPLGMLSLPTMLTASMREGSGTDLARERIASRRLRVLYHHCQLFHNDIGRWPVEVAELDGYIDFSGNAYLLKLDSSPKKKWNDFMEDLFDFDKDDEEDEEEGEDDDEQEQDELYADIDDSIYVVAWNDDRWTLGFEDDKFDHLQQLYIDEEGTIHRVEKTDEDTEEAEESAETESK